MLPGIVSFIKLGVDDSGGGTLEEGIISLEGEKREACVGLSSRALPIPPIPMQTARKALEEGYLGCGIFIHRVFRPLNGKIQLG